MTFDEIFNKVKDMFKDTDVSHITEHLAYQFNITGEGSGCFYVEVKDGKLIIEPYEYYDRDAIFICKQIHYLILFLEKQTLLQHIQLGGLKYKEALIRL